MREIILEPIPNQSFTLQLDGSSYDITIRTINHGLSEMHIIDVYIDNQPVILGQRLIDQTFVIPYLYLFDGNFFFTTRDNEIANYREFSITQFLYFVSIEEIEAIANGSV